MDPQPSRPIGVQDSSRALARAVRQLTALPAVLEDAIHRVAHIAVPGLGDWCVVDVTDRNGRLVAVAPGDPALGPLAGRLARMSHEERDAELQPRARIRVALDTGDRPLGVLTLMSTDPLRPFGAAALDDAETFAAMAGVALENVRLRRDISDAETRRTGFINSVVTEFRTPLHVVMGYADLLSAGIPEAIADRPRGQVEQIRRAAGHLLGLVERTLKYATAPEGFDPVEPAPLRLEALARELALLVEPLAAAKGLTFEVHAAPALPLVTTDAAKLRRILYHLLSNAIELTERGGVALTIRDEHRQIVLEVKDGAASSAIRDDGAIGLQTSRRLVRLLGGELSALTTVDRGTTMRLTLPVRFRGSGSPETDR